MPGRSTTATTPDQIVGALGGGSRPSARRASARRTATSRIMAPDTATLRAVARTFKASSAECDRTSAADAARSTPTVGRTLLPRPAPPPGPSPVTRRPGGALAATATTVPRYWTVGTAHASPTPPAKASRRSARRRSMMARSPRSGRPSTGGFETSTSGSHHPAGWRRQGRTSLLGRALVRVRSSAVTSSRWRVISTPPGTTAPPGSCGPAGRHPATTTMSRCRRGPSPSTCRSPRRSVR